MMLQYAVVYEKTPNNYGAYAPDVPGCGGVADTWEEMQDVICEAIQLHLELIREGGDPIPEPRMSLADAMADYAKMLSDDVDDGGIDEPLEVTFGWVEVAVPDYAPVGDPAAASRIADGN